jgi:hypothetical protein
VGTNVGTWHSPEKEGQLACQGEVPLGSAAQHKGTYSRFFDVGPSLRSQPLCGWRGIGVVVVSLEA